MNDTQALNQLIDAAAAMMQAGCAFAKGDDPAAFAAAGRIIDRTMNPRIEITLGDRVTVRGLVINDDGEDVVQLFEYTAQPNSQVGH